MDDVGNLRVADYLVAVEGLAMIRYLLTEPDTLSTRADEVAMITAGAGQPPLSSTIPLTRYDVEAGYSAWAPRYDRPNPAVETETPIVESLVRDLEPARALDAACGTGRHAALLHGLGWEVMGVDGNEAMLDLARAKVPGATFHHGRLEALPVEDGSVDLVVCALALTHVEELSPVIAELARVLRRGGRLVTTDMHPLVTLTGGMAAFPVDDHRADVAAGEAMTIHYVANLTHHPSTYVSAFLEAGLRITGCHEPRVDDDLVSTFPAFDAFPDATRQAYLGLPYLLVWEAVKA